MSKVYKSECPVCENDTYFIYTVLPNDTKNSLERLTFPAIVNIECSYCKTRVHTKRIQQPILDEADNVL